MANKALVLGAATAGGVMLYSGLAGVSVMDVLAGNASLKGADPKGGKGLNIDFRGAGNPDKVPPLVNVGGKTPKQVIDELVIPAANRHGINVSPASVAAANARHGPTITGGKSDHQGPPEERWAADMSNGEHPTPEMDQLASELARLFGLKWDGSGAVTGHWMGFRIQLIYKSTIGGNHFNHVHLGVERD